LARLRQVYSESSPAVAKAKNHLDSLKQGVVRQERLEVGKQVLEQLKAKRYQAQNTERVYLERIVPISIVEPAFTPKKSFSKLAIRYILSGSVGLILGLVLGLGLVVVLSTIDQRLYTSWDVEHVTSIPIFGWLADISKPRSKDKNSKQQLTDTGFPDSPQIESGLLQILGRLDASDFSTSGSTLLVASASAGEGRSFVSFRLASSLARSGKHSVLLIDSNVRNNSLTRFFGAQGKAGFIESVMDAEPFETHVLNTNVAGLSLLPSGDTSKQGDLGFYRRSLKELLDVISKKYDFVIIDTPPMLSGNEALVCSMAVDRVLLVVEASITRRPLFKAACQRLAEVGVRPQGVILNKKKEFLPAYIYRRV
jgi:capsular exopolysaccharide synthesis family protein